MHRPARPSTGLAALARRAERELAILSDEELDRLWEDLLDLPAIDPRLSVELPGDEDPDMQRIHRSVARGELEPDWSALAALAERIGTPRRRSALARAVVELRHERLLDAAEAAYALFDLHTNSPSRLITGSVVQAVAAAMDSPADLAA